MTDNADTAISQPIASVATDPKLRRAIEIIIELCYRYGRENYRRRAAGEVVNDSST